MKNDLGAKLSKWAIVAVAAFQFLVAVLGLILFVRSVRITMVEYSAEYPHPPWLVFTRKSVKAQFGGSVSPQ